MASIAIMAGMAVGTSLLSSALAPKPKLQPVDRGKLDDIRFTVMEEGAFKPLVYGRRVRLGGLIRWGTVTQEYVTRTPGRTSGKGGEARQAEPPTNSFTYRKSFAILFAGNRIKGYRRLWEDAEVVLNLAGADDPGHYEAESGLNTLTNASVIGSAFCSGGRAVQLNISTGAVQFNGVEGFGAATEFAFGYVASGATRTCQIWVNGALVKTVTIPGAGEVVLWYTDSAIDIPAGPGNTVKLVNTSSAPGALLFVDLLRVGEGELPPSDTSVTGVVNETGGGADPNDPADKNNSFPAADPTGALTGLLAAGGQAPFEFYTGTEEQLQSPTVVAVEGAENTPAWRGDSYVVFDDYLLKDGRLGNFTAEVEPYVQDLADVMTDLFLQDERAEASEIDFSALAGTTVEGFVVHTRQELGSWVDQLQLWYNFDVVPAGDKVIAVPRGGASSFTLTEEDLYAHHEGEGRPRGAVRQTHEDAADVPDTVDVLYLDPSAAKDFHTGGTQAQAQAGGGSFDPDTLTFAVVSDEATAVAVGRRYLDVKALEAKPFEFSTGPKWRHLLPGAVGQIVLPEATHAVRLTGVQAELQGLVRFKAVPERASVYTQTAPGQLSAGRETPQVEYPANTMLVVADCVPLRQEDVGSLVVYGAGCARGRGAWRGYALSREDLNGETERLGAAQKAATVGVVETASNSAQRTGYEATRSFVVKLYSGSLESRTLEDVRQERVNLAIYGQGSRWEVLQFLSVTAQAPTFPFVAEYLVTGTMTGIFGSDIWAGAHEDGNYFVLVDEAVQAFPVRLVDCGQPLTFVGQTYGQAYADAEAASSVALTLSGRSRQPLAPARVELEAETGLAPRDSAGSILAQVWPRSGVETIGDEYLAEFLSDDRTQVKHSIAFREGGPHPALLISYRAGSTDRYSNVSKNGLAVTSELASVRSVSLQTIQHPDNFVEATLRATGDGGATLGLIPAAADWRTSPGGYQILVTGGVAPGVYVNLNDGGGNVFVADYFSGDSVRVRIRILGTRVLFYAGAVTDSDQPVYESAVEPTYPLRLYLFANTVSGSGTSEAKDAFLTINPFASAVFTAEQQQLYYGTLKQPVQVRISQHSGVREVGYGPAWEGAI